uniref:BACK domain-containing protein n=1 Tax=Ascaris lumbricoides TaxID=6252 RepID=A0A9J2PNV6_ASCLU
MIVWAFQLRPPQITASEKLQQANKLPATLDLSNYAVTAVSTLCDFINDTGRANARITTLVLGDLMELSRILQIGLLRQKIDQFVLESAENSPGFLMHALTMLCNSRDLIESQLGQRVVDIAVADFSRISKTTSFNEIPGDVVLRLFDRCDLPVESEYELAEVAVKWLASKPERVPQAYRVLRCIRITNLSVDQRKKLDALTSSMPQYNATIKAFAHYAFNNTNALRVCTLAEHAVPCFKRCIHQVAQYEFTILLPKTRISLKRKKIPIKSSYVTAKPRKSTRSSEVAASGQTLLQRSVFFAASQRKTLRAERMAGYEKEAMKRFSLAGEYRRKRRHAVPPNNRSHNARLSSKEKEVRNEREGNVTSDNADLTKAAKANHRTNGSKPKPTGTVEHGKLPKEQTKSSLTSSSDEDSDSSSEKQSKELLIPDSTSSAFVRARCPDCTPLSSPQMRVRARSASHKDFPARCASNRSQLKEVGGEGGCENRTSGSPLRLCWKPQCS